ncbi:TPA: L-threonylcarbamoyladenylate synthase [Staphylococcus aureus]|uniref:L-threonylcarbamoyladenylate synthase n=1 Tax=Staphylococcus aureus TaxID=1280 RepID=UPI000CD14B70|nr:L-threonylcarbamoyladenylate synthase [Staphylococcus aureus]HAR7288912.1 Sua5/YciO/YrdC/YwlC family protein [Staphylococcus aureus]HAR7404018.1 Sua5/YciO/YrdC/YwlC family protein [Staphylococcus aureus]HAR7423729.1 Sua5/YciO/YrdC/YwlC family protein [Staphylococcus aureus]HAR7432214.1 Sua5/YciO/YrdC/YwlC family protein [Staphylococcus aureus]HAR7503196.1 Sua5/YciO/YrdC/YwlC family protein [Staphylococcus aureus]
MEILNDSVKSFEKLYLQLQDGFPVIVPTDTNYNLCSLPNNDLCIDKIFEYKKRSKDKPLSLFIDKPEDWKLYGDNQNTEIVDKLVEIFWPGPLNIILKNKTMRRFISYINSPIAITSANISGTADDILITENEAIKHMGENVRYMLRSQNKTNYKTSSTIIKVTDNKIELLREGDIKFEEIKERLGTGIIYE